MYNRCITIMCINVFISLMFVGVLYASDDQSLKFVITPEQIQTDWDRQDRLRNPWFMKESDEPRHYMKATNLAIQRGLKAVEALAAFGESVDTERDILLSVARRLERIPYDTPNDEVKSLYFEARWAVRKIVFRNPMFNFDSILFVKRAPGTLPHISDQYYGWWSRPGGGIYIVKDFLSDHAQTQCLTKDWPEGNFLRPELSYDGKKILFSYCRFYPYVSEMEKVKKEKLPEDAFYHIYEMNIDGSGIRSLTHGHYDDFDARYLPNGNIVFLSTRKGQFIQCSKENTALTVDRTLPDSYVRCGGDNKRPCAIYTLHAMNSKGGELRPISAFETFEYTPSIANDGRILYTRWDYIDRFNGHFFSLWSTNQDGSNPQLVYGNYTKRPQAVLEARSIPHSQKIVFTASAHHSIEGGSLVLLNPSKGFEGSKPLTRLTPEIPFPETEDWTGMYYTNPYPLSEDLFLVGWSDKSLPPHWGSRQVTGEMNPINALGLYIYDAFGNLELIYRDPKISSMYPIPVRSRIKPPVQASPVEWKGRHEGYFLIQDIYQGLFNIKSGAIQSLRIIGVPPKTQPHMNNPCLGVSKEDPGKFVLGTVPVEEDGSAYFRVPSGVPVFFQALDHQGMAVQTMRTLTYVQPNQTLSCIGCHEPRNYAPLVQRPKAISRSPSKIKAGPDGAWPLRFDRLIQPVLDRSCVRCHNPESRVEKAAQLDLTQNNAYQNLLAFAGRDLERLVFERDRSTVRDCPTRQSKLLSILLDRTAHHELNLDRESLDRFFTWMDVYAQRQGSFSRKQEIDLIEFRDKNEFLLTDISQLK